MAPATAPTASSWPTTRSCSTLLEMRELRHLAFEQARDRDAGPRADDLGDLLLGDLLAEHRRAGLQLLEPLRRPRRAGRSSCGDAPVADLGGALQVALALGALARPCCASSSSALRRWTSAMTSFSLSHCAFKPESCSVRPAISARSASRRSPQASSFSFCSACSSIWSWRSWRSTTSISVGHRVDLDAQAAGRLVDEVDRLVGQEAVGDVAVRERRRGHDRAVGDAHAVVHLVALLEAAQDRDRVLDASARRRRPAGSGARARRPSRCARGTRRAWWRRSACSSPRASAGLSMLHASIAPSAAPAPTSVCSSSMKRMRRPSACSISRSTAFRRSSNSPRYFAPATIAPRSSATTSLSLQRGRHVARDDALREALDDRGLAHARLADEHRVVLRAARQHLDDAADLLVAADDRVELALARGLGEVAAEPLERLELRLGVLVGHARARAQLLERLQRAASWSRPRLAEDAPGLAAVLGEREQQVLGRDVRVLELLGVLERVAEHAR